MKIKFNLTDKKTIFSILTIVLLATAMCWGLWALNASIKSELICNKDKNICMNKKIFISEYNPLSSIELFPLSSIERVYVVSSMNTTNRRYKRSLPIYNVIVKTNKKEISIFSSYIKPLSSYIKNKMNDYISSNKTLLKIKEHNLIIKLSAILYTLLTLKLFQVFLVRDLGLKIEN